MRKGKGRVGRYLYIYIAFMDLFQNKGHWWIFIVQTGGIPQTKLEPKINSCEPNRKF